MKSGLPFGWRRRLQLAYLFLVVYSTTGLAIVGALAPEWDLGLADLRPLEADLRQRALLQLGLLGC
jgi:hypothetical protein